mmetsp:Transcript_24057/g.50336  ORF Transcript_24057/g.50336 Transcript_24057/m.50336 type:complete len:232 (-) Transcript_24057:176-871(-)
MVFSTPQDSMLPPATRCIAVWFMLGVRTRRSAPAAMSNRTSSTFPQLAAASRGVIPTAKPLPLPSDTVLGSEPASSIFSIASCPGARPSVKQERSFWSGWRSSRLVASARWTFASVSCSLFCISRVDVKPFTSIPCRNSSSLISVGLRGSAGTAARTAGLAMTPGTGPAAARADMCTGLGAAAIGVDGIEGAIAASPVMCGDMGNVGAMAVPGIPPAPPFVMANSVAMASA